MVQLNEAKNVGDENADLKTEQGLWQYVETQLAAEVRAGDIVLRPHWKGAMSPDEIRDVIRLASTAPALYDAVLTLLSAMEMQEGREQEELHIPQRSAWHVWTNAKLHARAALALVNKPDTNSANSIHPAHGQAYKTEVQK